MAQTIKLRRSATQGGTPTVSQLSLGEVAINTYDGKMYIKKDSGTASIVEIGGGNLPLTGGTISGHTLFSDNVEARWGNGADLKIYHDGSNSYITDSGTGDLKIGGANVVITTASGTKYFEGASNRAFLFHTGNQKLVTTSTGIGVTGSVVSDGLTSAGTILATSSTTISTILRGGDGNSKNLVFQKTTGSAQQAKISAVGDDLRFTTGPTTERMRIDSSGNVFIGSTSDSGTDYHRLSVDGFVRHKRDGAVVAVFDRDTSDGDIVYFRKDGGTVGSIGTSNSSSVTYLAGSASGGGIAVANNSAAVFPARPAGVIDNTINLGSGSYRFKDLYLSNKVYANYIGSSGDTNTNIYFPTGDQIRFVNGGSESMRLDSQGRVNIGNSTNFSTADGDDLQVGNTSGSHGITIVGQNTATANLFFGDNNYNDAGAIRYNHTHDRMEFYTARTQRMSISSTGAVTFNQAFTLPTADGSANQLLKTDGSGNVSWATVSGSGTPTYLADADGDTKIQVEESADEDTIRFDAAGVERFKIGSDVQVMGTTDFNITGSNRRISFTSGTGTVRTSGASSLNFGTSNTDRMTITSAGNVGIGNVVSQAYANEGTYTTKLRVGSDTLTTDQASVIQIAGKDSTGNGPLGAIEFLNHRDNDVSAKIVGRRDLGSSSYLGAGQLDFYTDDGNGNLDINMSIDADGNVGIGTDSPSHLLELSNTMASSPKHIFYRMTGTNATGGGAGIKFDSSASNNDASLYWSGIQGIRTTSNDGSNELRFWTTSTAEASGAPSQRMVISETGNVGIGTTAPAVPLHVNGFARLGGLQLSATTANIVNIANGDLKLGTNNTEKMRITAAGNVGIGTTAPGGKLHVAGSIVAEGSALLRKYASSWTSPNQTHDIIYNAWRANTGDYTYIKAAGNSGTTHGILAVGDLGTWIGTTDIEQGALSDSGTNPLGTTNAFFKAATSYIKGNLGIGTSAPDTKLDITTTGVQGLIINQDTGSASVSSRLFFKDSTRTNLIMNVNGLLEFRTDATIGSTSGSRRLWVSPTLVETSIPLRIEECQIDTTTTSTTAVTQVAIDSMVAATFRSARYTIQVTNSTDGTYHLTEMLLIHNGTTPSINEFGTIYTGSAAEAAFTADINSGNVRILATPASTDAMAFKVVRHSITV